MQSVSPQEKQININGLNVNYKQIGNGDVLIILLHGWGVSSDKYLELARWLHSPEGLWSQNANVNSLRNANARRLHRTKVTMEPASQITNYELRIIIPDLPGFGKSDEPKENWDLDNYVEFVDKFNETVLRKKGFELIKNILKNFDPKKAVYVQKKDKVIIIGHSFGGRIAIKYTIEHPDKIEKLILTGAAGIKHPLNRKQRIFYILAKIGKKIFSILKEAKFPIGSLASVGRKFLYKIAREKDYYQASPRMKEIMKNALNEDLAPILDKIKTPTLLVWGANDNSTPLSDGKIMNEKIKNSELVIFNGANHSLPYQKPKEFARVVMGFIKK